VPEDVVQILERVQIEQEHRDGWFCVAAVCDLPLDRFVQRPAVAQAGELVAERSRMRVRERLISRTVIHVRQTTPASAATASPTANAGTCLTAP